VKPSGNPRQAQQGDVNAWQIAALPETAQRTADPIVRHGEVTGHAHRLVGPAGAFEMYKDGDRIFAKILARGCALLHEEHGTIEEHVLVPAGDLLTDGSPSTGIVEFGPTHEWDYDAQESRALVD
jgi:hypothetical protein